MIKFIVYIIPALLVYILIRIGLPSLSTAPWLVLSKADVAAGIGILIVYTLIIVLWMNYRYKKIYYRYNIDQSRRLFAEQENAMLRLEQDYLRLEVARMEDEREHLTELLNRQQALDEPMQTVIKERLNVLNGLLAKEISENESYAKPFRTMIESIHRDQVEFMESTRLVFSASHPTFMEYLVSHGLTDDEIRYACLYALGLRGKEIGQYTKVKGHYNTSSTIRKKLGIDEHQTNIGPYIRRLMEQLN